MDTRGKTHAEFRMEVSEAIAKQEAELSQVNSNVEQLGTTLQNVLLELQSLRRGTLSPRQSPDTNPFHQGESSHTENEPHRPQLKLYFPKFEGDEPQGWIYKTEQYFEFMRVPFDQRVSLASFHLEGLALQWHRWYAKYHGPATWTEFTKALLLCFGPTDFEDPSEALTRLRQLTTVVAYQENFERLSHCVDGLPKSFLIGCFIAGLKDEVRLDVKIKNPRTLADAIGVACLIEERNSLQRRSVPFPR